MYDKFCKQNYQQYDREQRYDDHESIEFYRIHYYIDDTTSPYDFQVYGVRNIGWRAADSADFKGADNADFKAADNADFKAADIADFLT
jgi:hypothetical protein